MATEFELTMVHEDEDLAWPEVPTKLTHQKQVKMCSMVAKEYAGFAEITQDLDYFINQDPGDRCKYIARLVSYLSSLMMIDTTPLYHISDFTQALAKLFGAESIDEIVFFQQFCHNYGSRHGKTVDMKNTMRTAINKIKAEYLGWDDDEIGWVVAKQGSFGNIFCKLVILMFDHPHYRLSDEIIYSTSRKLNVMFLRYTEAKYPIEKTALPFGNDTPLLHQLREAPVNFLSRAVVYKGGKFHIDIPKEKTSTSKLLNDLLDESGLDESRIFDDIVQPLIHRPPAIEKRTKSIDRRTKSKGDTPIKAKPSSTPIPASKSPNTRKSPTKRPLTPTSVEPVRKSARIDHTRDDPSPIHKDLSPGQYVDQEKEKNYQDIVGKMTEEEIYMMYETLENEMKKRNRPILSAKNSFEKMMSLWCTRMTHEIGTSRLGLRWDRSQQSVLGLPIADCPSILLTAKFDELKLLELIGLRSERTKKEYIELLIEGKDEEAWVFIERTIVIPLMTEYLDAFDQSRFNDRVNETVDAVMNSIVDKINAEMIGRKQGSDAFVKMRENITSLNEMARIILEMKVNQPEIFKTLGPLPRDDNHIPLGPEHSGANPYERVQPSTSKGTTHSGETPSTISQNPKIVDPKTINVPIHTEEEEDSFFAQFMD